MKCIGLLGGMSWESSLLYYQLINTQIKERLGGLHSANCVLYSVDFEPIERRQTRGEWDICAEILTHAAQSLEKAGAEYILLCTNTMHKVLPQVQPHVSIPFIHIADATARVLQQQNITTVGLLGTRYTMEQDFYKQRLQAAGIQVVIPAEEARGQINQIIFEELCQGIVKEESKQLYLQQIQELANQGAQGVVLGCTEIGMLVQQADTSVPLFDTTAIHAESAVDFALST